jgi:FkbM family methyltransferase
MIAEMMFTKEDRSFLIMINDYHLATEMMRENDFYEHWLLDFIKNNFSGGTFVDVGANTGNHAVYFSAYCADKVIAIEPLLQSYELLRVNMAQNCTGEEYRLVQVAVSDTAGTGYMTVPNPKEQSIGGTFLSGGIGEEVQVVTLDELLKDEEDVRLIKIDVEGGELKVINGAMEIITKHRPDLFVEIFNDAILHHVTKLLEPYGYEMKERYCYAPVYHFSTRADIPRTFTHPVKQ